MLHAILDFAIFGPRFHAVRARLEGVTDTVIHHEGKKDAKVSPVPPSSTQHQGVVDGGWKSETLASFLPSW
jgi:hypothetical protein